MKKIIALIILIAFSSVTSFAQEKKKRIIGEFKKNLFYFSVADLASNTITVGLEKTFKTKDGLGSNGIRLNFSTSYLENYGNYSYSSNSDHEITESYGGELQYKFYIYEKLYSRTAFRLFMAPYAQFKTIHYQGQSSTYDQNSTLVVQNNKLDFYMLGGGFLFGLHQTMFRRVDLCVYAGAGMRRTDKTLDRSAVSSNSNIFNSDGVFYNGVVPKVGIDIGIRF